MGQYNDRVRRAAAHIPHGSVAQSRFKLEVVHLYSRGYPIAEAVVEAREWQRRDDPGFQPLPPTTSLTPDQVIA